VHGVVLKRFIGGGRRNQRRAGHGNRACYEKTKNTKASDHKIPQNLRPLLTYRIVVSPEQVLIRYLKLEAYLSGFTAKY